MEKKTASDMRLLLSSFEPEYPVKKGYIAQLIVNEKLLNVEIARKIIDIVKAEDPDRQVHEGNIQASIANFKRIATRKFNYTSAWTDILNLHNQTFNIPFKSQMVACTPMPIQENTPEIPAATTDLTPDSSNEILPDPMLSGSPSPRRLRRDCDSCVAKQRTCINMLKENKRLRLKMREQNKRQRHFRKQYEDMKKQFKDMKKQKEMLQNSEGMLRMTNKCLISCVEENRTLKGTIEEYKWLLKKSENNS